MYRKCESFFMHAVCMFVHCVHSVTVFNVAFYLICSLLMLVEDVRGNQMYLVCSHKRLLMFLVFVEVCVKCTETL